MMLIKHSTIDNFSVFEDEEKKNLVMQELSKAYMIYPKAIADVLDNCNIAYRSQDPKDLETAVVNNVANLKMLNKIVRISFLVNKNGGQTLETHDPQITYRELMKTGKPFVREHHEHMKVATLLSREMMREETFSPKMGKILHNYLNMDGGVSEVEEPEVVVSKAVVKPPLTTGTKVFIVLGTLTAAGLVFYGLKKLIG